MESVMESLADNHRVREDASGVKGTCNQTNGRIITVFTEDTTEGELLKFIENRINFSHRGTLGQRELILTRYKDCFQINRKLTREDLEIVKKWILEKRFICWKLGGLFDVAFPKKLTRKLTPKEKSDILSKIEKAEMQHGKLLGSAEGSRNTMNHLGLVGMTRDEAIKFMKKVLPEYVS